MSVKARKYGVFCAVLTLMLLGAALVSAANVAEKQNMPLDVTFQCPQTLILQQNPVCTLTITNSGKTPASFLHPQFNTNSPIVRVIELKTGAEVLQQKGPMPQGEEYQTLAPGATLTHQFALLSRANLTMPGEYELSMIIPSDAGKSKAESNSVRVKLLPSTPKNFNKTFVQGGWATVQYGVCVNITADPQEIVRYSFNVKPKAGVTDASSVCKGGLRLNPFLSAPSNGSVAHTHWIGWIDKDAFWFTHFDPALGALAPRRWDHGGVEAQVVEPLFIGAADAGDRPAGAAMIWVGDPAANSSVFQIVQLAAPGKATPGGRATITGQRPDWMMSHARSNNTRVVTYSQPTAGGSALFVLPWPDQALASNPLKKLAEFKSQHVAGGAALFRDDTIHAGSLLLTVSPGVRKLEMVHWTLDVKNNYAEKDRAEVPWPYSRPVPRAIVRIGPGGAPSALLQDDQGKWSVYHQGKLLELSADLATTKMPIDLAFLNEVQPVLIVGQELRGFKVVQLNGQPLPKDPR